MQCDGKPCGSEATFLRAPGEPFYVSGGFGECGQGPSRLWMLLLPPHRQETSVAKIPKYSAQT